MIVGHTKFSPDRHFGTIKKLLRQKGCYSIVNLTGDTGIIKESAVDNEIIMYQDLLTKQKSFEWLRFDEFLSKKYGPCRGIHGWHIIKILQDSSTIYVSKHVGAPFEEYNNIITSAPLIGQPDIIEPNGLSPSRLGQLKHFESFVPAEYVHFISTDFRN